MFCNSTHSVGVANNKAVLNTISPGDQFLIEKSACENSSELGFQVELAISSSQGGNFIQVGFVSASNIMLN